MQENIILEKTLEEMFDMGYNINGEQAPYLSSFDRVDEETLDHKALCNVSVDDDVIVATLEWEEATMVGDGFELIVEENLIKLKAGQLKDKLKKWSLGWAGLKKELLD